ncbi:MAG: MoaD/ThiS family protein [Pseudomonadales bacterium]|nr:MoaD/ThiS family protein [Pseudomonadales bacterium]
MTNSAVRVEVRFFASLREATGCPALALELPAGADFAALCAVLADRLGPAALEALTAGNVRVARNQTLATPPFALADGDEVAFLPPVTGG